MTLIRKKKFQIHIRQQRILSTGYFTSGNEPNGIKNAPHNIFSKKAGHFNFSNQFFSEM
jgi:hypothetical protein